MDPASDPVPDAACFGPAELVCFSAVSGTDLLPTVEELTTVTGGAATLLETGTGSTGAVAEVDATLTTGVVEMAEVFALWFEVVVASTLVLLSTLALLSAAGFVTWLTFTGGVTATAGGEVVFGAVKG